jgi:hypothetical protein
MALPLSVGAGPYTETVLTPSLMVPRKVGNSQLLSILGVQTMALLGSPAG